MTAAATPSTVTVSVLTAEVQDPTGPSSGVDHDGAGLAEIPALVARTTGGQVIESGPARTSVVYASLGAALEAALAMQQRTERRCRGAATPSGLRIGLSNGDASVLDGRFTGDVVDEAAALCVGAPPGQIAVSDIVRLLARRFGHRFEVAGPEAGAAGAWSLAWEPAEAEPLAPLPARLAQSTPAEVVGRRSELDRLCDTQLATAHGAGIRVVLLSGEPGIGKTTLAGVVAARAAEMGTTVLYGRCDEDLGVPYQPFAEALDDLVAHLSDAVLGTIEPRHLGALTRLVPAVRRRIPDLVSPPGTDADAERYLLFGAVRSVLAALAARTPLLVVLDDLHWTDRPTVALLVHLAETLGDAEVCVVATYRESEVEPGHPLADRLGELQRAGAEQVSLRGLDDQAVVALLESLAGHEMDADGIGLARDVHRETGGNPFFCTELLRHLAETEAIAQVDGRWIAVGDLSEVGLPDSVREVVGQRVRRLGADAERILTMASVIGRDFDLSLLAQLVADGGSRSGGGMSLAEVIEAAVDAEIVVAVDERPDRFTFTHALYQHSLHGQLSASRRARAHRRLAQLLESECGDAPGDRIGELAHHWLAGARPSEAAKAAEFARRAGVAALDALAPDEAIRWFRTALEELGTAPATEPTQQLDLLIALGDAQRQAGEPGYREALLGAADFAARRGDTGRQVAASLANQRGMVSSIGSVDAARIASLEEAVRAVRQEDSPERALLFASLTAELPFHHETDRIRATAAEAEAIARRLGDDAILLRVLNLTFLPLWVPDALDLGMARTEEAVELAERIGDPVGRYLAAVNRTQILVSAADRDGMDSALAPALAMADEIGQPYMRWQVLYLRCRSAILAGDVAEAEQLATESLEVGMASGQPDVAVVYGANLINIRFQQDRLEEILPLIESSAAENPGLPGFRAALAMALCECGRPDDAEPLLRQASAEDFHDHAYDYVWLTTTTLWAETACWLGDVPAARRLHDRLAPFAGQGISSGASFSGTCAMYLARLLAVLGRSEDAMAMAAAADRQLDALGAPFWRARNQLEWARLLDARGEGGDRERARALVDQAQAAAARFGCPGVTRRADELLRSFARS